MQIENAVKVALQKLVTKVMNDNHIGLSDALKCEVRLGFNQEKIDHLPLIAIDKAETQNVAIELGRSLGGRNFDMAIHVWGKTEWQAEEIVGMIVEGLKLPTSDGAFPIYDYSSQKPAPVPQTTPPTAAILPERDDNVLGVGLILMDQSTTAKAEDSRQFTRMVLFAPILVNLVKPAVG